ncbi:FAD/FMN-containing dehydrogenase [Penicillium odoratum]|uniref:FAD/FMN-containing dehydrogenase n=1 Tax=Penicillium odoratum TaxID=1167516 RepID=UPI002546E7DB|nr:FAD/FMN-containing dehydrogenase [Penicillium odoratum]KAJ5768738.1 FAD/FMN-containing dehydrogenase [Penicillium odoratum]
MMPITLPGGSKEKLQGIMAPLLAGLNRANMSYFERFRTIINYGAVVSGVSVNASLSRDGKSAPTNSVNPAWHDAAIDIVVGTLSDTNQNYNIEAQKLIADVLLPELEDLTPGGGAYLNEADPHQPDWKYAFYNENYDRLLSVKNKYDPKHIFYGTTAVGSDYWVEADGRLCRA